MIGRCIGGTLMAAVGLFLFWIFTVLPLYNAMNLPEAQIVPLPAFKGMVFPTDRFIPKNSPQNTDNLDDISAWGQQSVLLYAVFDIDGTSLILKAMRPAPDNTSDCECVQKIIPMNDYGACVKIGSIKREENTLVITPTVHPMIVLSVPFGFILAGFFALGVCEYIFRNPNK